MNRLIIILFIFLAKLSFAQKEIDWSVLADVEFTDLYIEEVDEYFLYPHFGPSVRELAGKEVMIRGFVLAIDPTQNYISYLKGRFLLVFSVVLEDLKPL